MNFGPVMWKTKAFQSQSHQFSTHLPAVWPRQQINSGVTVPSRWSCCCSVRSASVVAESCRIDPLLRQTLAAKNLPGVRLQRLHVLGLTVHVVTASEWIATTSQRRVSHGRERAREPRWFDGTLDPRGQSWSLLLQDGISALQKVTAVMKSESGGGMFWLQAQAERMDLFMRPW